MVLAGSLVGWSPAAAAPPAMQPDNKPTPVQGQNNGELPGNLLIQVAPNCLAYRPAGPSMGLLLATARNQGVALETRQCYRPLSEQVAVQRSWTSAGNSACAAPVSTTPSGKPKGTSMHGWAKAADFAEPGGMSWGTAGFRWLFANSGRFGWNKPGWALPGGSACPEVWHWEWVGDGGTMGAAPIRADVVGLVPAADGRGYSTITGLGAVISKGDAASHGDASSIVLNAPIVAATSTPDGQGYWLVASDGGLFGFGSAGFFGSTGNIQLNQPIVGMAATPDGQGYWLVAADGGVFSFGSASFYGSPASKPLNRPVIGMAATPDGHGYWLVASDGGVFSFGNAAFYGSTGNIRLNQPVIAVAATPDGHGYWMAASDGGIFGFGNAQFAGSAGDRPLTEPVVAMSHTPSGKGYWLVGADGGVFCFGDAGFYGAG